MGTYFHVNLSGGRGGQNFSFPTLFDSYRELLLTFNLCFLRITSENVRPFYEEISKLHVPIESRRSIFKKKSFIREDAPFCFVI